MKQLLGTVVRYLTKRLYSQINKDSYYQVSQYIADARDG